MKLKVYLDASIFCALFDRNRPERMSHTEVFWNMAEHFALSTMPHTLNELAVSTDPELKHRLPVLCERVKVLPSSPEITELAKWYIEVGAFSALFPANALNLAASVQTRQDVLLSWDFRNLVNRRTRFLIRVANDSANLPAVDILTPQEL